MARTDPFAETFAALRAILEPHTTKLQVVVDTPKDFQVASRTLTDRTGRPLFVAAVQIKKNYVSFHLMPIYAVPGLRDRVSASLAARMQGKACFNFRTIEAAQVKELAGLTRKGIREFEKVQLPWARPAS